MDPNLTQKVNSKEAVLSLLTPDQPSHVAQVREHKFELDHPGEDPARKKLAVLPNWLWRRLFPAASASREATEGLKSFFHELLTIYSDALEQGERIYEQDPTWQTRLVWLVEGTEPCSAAWTEALYVAKRFGISHAHASANARKRLAEDAGIEYEVVEEEAGAGVQSGHVEGRSKISMKVRDPDKFCTFLRDVLQDEIFQVTENAKTYFELFDTDEARRTVTRVNKGELQLRVAYSKMGGENPLVRVRPVFSSVSEMESGGELVPVLPSRREQLWDAFRAAVKAGVSVARSVSVKDRMDAVVDAVDELARVKDHFRTTARRLVPDIKRDVADFLASIAAAQNRSVLEDDYEQHLKTRVAELLRAAQITKENIHALLLPSEAQNLSSPEAKVQALLKKVLREQGSTPMLGSSFNADVTLSVDQTNMILRDLHGLSRGSAKTFLVVSKSTTGRRGGRWLWPAIRSVFAELSSGEAEVELTVLEASDKVNGGAKFPRVNVQHDVFPDPEECIFEKFLRAAGKRRQWINLVQTLVPSSPQSMGEQLFPFKNEAGELFSKWTGSGSSFSCTSSSTGPNSEQVLNRIVGKMEQMLRNAFVAPFGTKALVGPSREERRTVLLIPAEDLLACFQFLVKRKMHSGSGDLALHRNKLSTLLTKLLDEAPQEGAALYSQIFISFPDEATQQKWRIAGLRE